MVCFVPGCKSGNSAKEKCHLMKISKSATADIRTTWLQNIPKQQNKSFDFSVHHICHKHFEDKFIIKTSTVMMGSLVMSEIPRIRWKLTDDAIPTIFSNEKVPKYFDRKTSTRRPPKLRSVEAIKIFNVDVKEERSPPEPDELVNVSLDFEKVQLPPLWTYVKTLDTIRIFKLVEDEREDRRTFHTERSITINPNRPPTVTIRDKQVDVATTTPFGLPELIAIIKKVDQLPICSGIRNYNLIKVIDRAYRCGNAWIAVNCEQTLEETGICDKCTKLRPELRHRAESTLNLTTAAQKPRDTKIMKYQKKSKIIARTMRRIKHRVNNLQASLKIMQRKFHNLEETSLENAINTEINLTPQMKMGLITAAQVAKVKSKHGVRYRSDWILQALLLKICSPKAYRHLRDNNVLPLPHPRYLTSLLKGLPCQFGFNDFVFKMLEKEFHDKPKRDRQFMLIFDEMKIREAISYDTMTMKFSGYIDYGEFTSDYKVKRSKRCEADHALVFMCRCLNSKMTQPIASFATRGSAPGNVLAKMIISCISKLEAAGCEVIGVISDGATSNKSAWKALGLYGDKHGVVNKIENPHDESRFIHFLCDIPHIMKCIRNHIHKAGYVNFSNQPVNWGFYRALYDVDKSSDIRVAYKLTYQHINPNPFQKMVVSLATQVFSKSVADGLKFYRDAKQHALFKDSESTEIFTRKLNDLFDACNARVPKDGVRKKSKSYEVIREFLSNLSKEDTFASSVTMASIHVTLRSVLDLVDYLCDVIGFSYVLTAKFNQDCLENFFGLLRSFGGDDCHPTATSFSHLFRLLSLYMPTMKTLKGNIRVEEEYSVVSYLDSLKALKNSAELEVERAKKEVNNHILSKVMCHDEQVFEEDNLLIHPSSLQCNVYHLCGFLVYKAKTFTDCLNCLQSLEDPNPTATLSCLTEIKDLGRLRYPSMHLFRLICHNVEPKIVDVLANEDLRVSQCVTTCIATSLDEINCAGIGCSKDHGYSLVINLINYYITLRMYFFSTKQNKDFLRSNTETKKKMKEAKLS